MLAGEPWCWHREIVNNQTDYYLWEIVVRPAVRRAKEFDEKNKGGKVGHGWEEDKRKLPGRAAYVAIGQRLGVPKEVSEAEYDKFLASRRK